MNLRPLALEPEHIAVVRHLPHYHRDPFDRILVAQARHEGLTLVTHDDIFDRYGLPTLKT
jgi:PIN domain nuclease of toxin-antitoxin system